MKTNASTFSAILTMTFLMLAPLSAQEIDEARVKELVQEEVERLLNREDAFDIAIERGIHNHIQKQQQAAQQAQMQQQRDQAKNLRPVDETRDHIFGDVNAPITLVEYSDFECPFCKRFHPTVVSLLEKNKGTVRWVYRHFPLGFHNPGAQKQAEASECVAKIAGNDAFWEYSDQIYKRTKSNGKGFPLDKLLPLAVEVGVDGEAFSKCYESGEMTARVKEEIANGESSGVSGTPAAFMSNKKGDVRVVSGALPLQQFQAIVDQLSE